MMIINHEKSNVNFNASRSKTGVSFTFARKIPGAYIGIKVAALLPILDGQPPGWIIEVLGLDAIWDTVQHTAYVWTPNKIKRLCQLT